MSCLYWDDFDCTPESRAIEHPDTIHVHMTDEHKLAVAFDTFDKTFDGTQRYHCFRGPGGLVRGVAP